MDYARDVGMDRFDLDMAGVYTCCQGSPDYLRTGAGRSKHRVVLGLPVGDYPRSRAPQAVLPDAAKAG